MYISGGLVSPFLCAFRTISLYFLYFSEKFFQFLRNNLSTHFLATLVALHSTPVSKSVGRQSFGLQPSSVAWSLLVYILLPSIALLFSPTEKVCLMKFFEETRKESDTALPLLRPQSTHVSC